MANDGETRRLAAIVVTDIVAYSRLMAADESGTLVALKALRKELWYPKIEEYGGRVVKLMGDGQLMEFSSVVAAVECAVDIQRAMARRNADIPEDLQIVIRLGINLGDVIIDGDDIYGDGVNVAARLESEAEPGGICISRKVRDDIRDKLSLLLEDMGEVEVKNMARPVRIFRVNLDGSRVPGASSEPDVLTLPTGKPSIAILPFDNMSGDDAQEYFSDGITEDIITALSRNGGLFVIARNSSFAYRAKSPDIQKVGQELGVRYVLEGSVRRAGDRVRVTAQLIEAATGNHVWAEKYDRELTDIFAVQDEITENVSGAVGSEVFRAEIGRAAKLSAAELGAWELSLRAWWHVQRITKEDSAKARELCHEEIALMGDSATSYSALAFTHLWDSLYGWSGHSPEAAGAQAAKAAQTAISIDPNDDLARTILATVYWFAGNLEGAIRECELALEHNPNFNVAHAILGILLCRVEPDQFERSSEHFQRALRLGPRDPWVPTWTANWSMNELVLGRIEEAIESARKAVRLGPHIPIAHRALASALALKGDMAGAREAWADVMRVQPDFNPETYLPSLAKLFGDEAQFKTLRRGILLASGAETPASQ